MAGKNQVTRRSFLGTTAAAGATTAAVPYFVSSRVLGADGGTSANDRIHVGLIGCGGMGSGNLANCAAHKDVVVTAVCDVQQSRLDAAVAKYKKSAKPYKDFRDLLAAPDVDGVIIASPPHWHALQAIAACEAGKDLYLQKPMTLHLGESFAVMNAVKKHNRVCQVGTQIHAGQNYRRVVEFIRSGNLGRVSTVRTFNVMNQGPNGIGVDKSTGVPPGIDWEMWIGPGPMRPYNGILAASSYNHCSFMDYSGGWLPGMAPHIIDLPIWALELDYPTLTTCAGGRFVIQDDGDAPDVQEILWQYPQITMTWMGNLANSYGFDLHGEPVPKRRLGIYFHGLNGTMFCDYGMFKIVPEGDRMKDLQPPPVSLPPSPGHEREWLNCIKTRQQPSCSVFYHTKIDVPIILANLSLKLGRSIRFDPSTKKIVGDDEAARRTIPEYRAPWKFPVQYLET